MKMYTWGLRRFAPIIFAVSWIVRIALVFAQGSQYLPVNPAEPVLVARSLAAGEGFSNPYGCMTGPSAHLAPVYPFLLSEIYRALPAGSSRELTVFIFGTTIVSLMYCLLPWLAVKLRLDPVAGILAGFAGALFPLFFWVEVTSEWEAGLTALLLVVGLGMFVSVLEECTIRRAIAAGIVWGVALLSAPTMLLVLVALSVALAWSRYQRPRPLLQSLAAIWLPVVVILMPWTVRNYEVFHEFILTRGNTGLQLHMSFNPLARATFEASALNGAFADHPHTTPEACREFARYGEVVMNRRYEQQAREWIAAHPGRSVQLVAEHSVAFWTTPLPSRGKTIASELLTLLGLTGWGYCLKKHKLAGRLIGIVLLVYPLAYYVNFFDVRYRYPLHPLILLSAFALLSDLARRRRSGTS